MDEDIQLNDPDESAEPDEVDEIEQDEPDGDEPEYGMPITNDNGEEEWLSLEEAQSLIKAGRQLQNKADKAGVSIDAEKYLPILREVNASEGIKRIIDMRRQYPGASEAQILAAVWQQISPEQPPQFETEEERKEYERELRIQKMEKDNEMLRREMQYQKVRDNNDRHLFAALDEYGHAHQLTQEQSQAILSEWAELWPDKHLDRDAINAKQAKTLIFQALGKNEKKGSKETPAKNQAQQTFADLQRAKQVPRVIPGKTTRQQEQPSANRPLTREQRLAILASD